MKKTAFLIDTSRWPLVDEQALAEALNSERIAGAGLDVLSEEPPEKNNSLLKAKKLFHNTSHRLGYPRSTRKITNNSLR